MKKKIGILGGTFDPVHVGHLVLAGEARREYGLEKVIFIPAAVPPHKKTGNVSSFEHRLRMLEIACDPFPFFSSSSIEGELPEPSYTIDTIKALQSRAGLGHTFLFIIGCDAFLEIPTWKSHRQVARLVSFIVSKRAGIDEKQLAELARYLHYKIVDSSVWISTGKGKSIFFLKDTPPDISSTSIREKIRDKQITAGTLPEKVIEYIEAKKLYGDMRP